MQMHIIKNRCVTITPAVRIIRTTVGTNRKLHPIRWPICRSTRSQLVAAEAAATPWSTHPILAFQWRQQRRQVFATDTTNRTTATWIIMAVPMAAWRRQVHRRWSATICSNTIWTTIPIHFIDREKSKYKNAFRSFVSCSAETNRKQK